ncbi:hypothetical protein [Magnetospirillum sp. UT-4]|uniref:hypothetical protein n=1 Tax=Magnetospirillum sp. UT-4 TaxID=2681467 RepID=UPI00137DCCEF|nr:hypothetical protein [Magnetospirillum sp. UT-4]CAA7612182.1 exported hypothetical protein [Magnetospirillum sp. UT-4]
MIAVAVLFVVMMMTSAPASGADCTPEANRLGQAMQGKPGDTASNRRALGTAQRQCRDDPAKGRATLDSTRRTMRDQNARPQSGYRTPSLRTPDQLMGRPE